MATADVFIQAGHQGRTSGATGAANNTVGLTELHHLYVITSRATAVLRSHGVTVIHEDASLSGEYNVKLAVFCHFDGSTNKTVKASSVGYDDDSDKAAALAWKGAYGQVWPWGFHGDNFTNGLRYYYGYKYTKTTDAEFLIEFGTITNDEVAVWIKERLTWLGDFLAWFISERIGNGTVPYPSPFNATVEEPVSEIVIPKWLAPAWEAAEKVGYVSTDPDDETPDLPGNVETLGQSVTRAHRAGWFTPQEVVDVIDTTAVDEAVAALDSRIAVLEARVVELEKFDQEVRDL